MKRLLLLGVLAAAVLVPVAAASPAVTHTLRGTVVAKDSAHHALVVALPGGKVQTLVAPAAFGRTDIGRKVAIRYTTIAGRLPVALGVSLTGHTSHAALRGTIVRLVKRHAILNAGGSVLNVTLKAPKGQRALASAKVEPQAQVGDTVKVEVEIDANGSLNASAVVTTAVPAVQQAGSEGEMEVRGKVTGLPSSAAPQLTVLTGNGVSVSCDVPASVTVTVKINDPIELECDLIGGRWTVRVAHGENEHSGSGDDESSQVKVRGTIKALTVATDANPATVTVDSVVCTIPKSIVLAPLFAVNDVVKMECIKVGSLGTLTLKEIEKKGGSSSEQSGDDNDDNDDGSDSGESDD